MRPSSLLALTLLALAPALPAAADPVDLYGRQVEFLLPAGYCFLDESNPDEKVLVDAIVQSNQGSNDLIAYVAPCNDLVAYRVGAIAVLTEYAIVFVPLVDGSFQPSPVARAESLPQIASSMPALDEAALQELERQASENPHGVTLSGSQFLGLIGQDGNAVYAGMLSNVSDGTTTSAVAGVLAITQVRDIVLTFNVYRPYRSNADIVALLTEAEAYVGDLVAANP